MQPDILALVEEQRAIAATLTSSVSTEQLPWRIHRNTIWHGWIEALGDSYPVVKALIGNDSFSAHARDFLLYRPPSSAALKWIGNGFPQWLDGQPVSKTVPYLVDVARLEHLWLNAFHAPDQEPLAPDAIGQFEPEQMLELVAQLHPSTGFVESAFPIDVVFQVHQSDVIDTDQFIALPDRGVCLMIARPGFDVLVLAVDPVCRQLAIALSSGRTLGQALKDAGGLKTALPHLQYLLAQRLITNLSIKEN